jgi:HAD superfamily hydrolase (TIGR01459 family)
MTPVAALSEIAPRYEAAFVDLWGCVHDGARAIPSAVAALQAFRRGGGLVILVTNSPRPREGVAAQLDGFGVPRDAWDDIASSGDAARLALWTGAVGTRIHHIGMEGDEAFFTPPDVVEDPAPVERVALDAAEALVVTGPPDPQADPSVWRPTFLAAKTRGLPLLCANPDIVVDRGGVREWCAGALAKLYTEMGGESLYFGKPHPPIYDLARRRLSRLRDLPDASILAIGDGPGTDIAGAMGEGLDSLFVTGGLAAAETGTAEGGTADPARLAAHAEAEGIAATYSIGMLR